MLIVKILTQRLVMPGCQAVMNSGRHCRNYARKHLTCCYSHKYLEDTLAEIEVPVKKVVKLKSNSHNTEKCAIWGTPEVDNNGVEIQFLNSFY